MWKPKPKPPSLFQELFKAATKTAMHTAAKHAVREMTDEAAREFGEGHLFTHLARGAEQLLGHHEHARRQAQAAHEQAAFATGRIGYQAAAMLTGGVVDHAAAQLEREAQERQAARERLASLSPDDLYAMAQEAERDQRQQHAFALYHASATRGHVRAMNDLAFCYDDGIGTGPDKGQAQHWYRQAATAGHANAQFNLGVSLHYGEAGTVNQPEAGYWFRLAAQQGHAGAQCFAGHYYRDGSGGLPRDRSEARRWYGLAVAQGYADALTALLVMDVQDPQKPAAETPPSADRGENQHPRGSVAWAREELDVKEDATAEDIKAAWRRRIKWAHSDHGGDDGYAADLNLAKKVLLDAL